MAHLAEHQMRVFVHYDPHEERNMDEEAGYDLLQISRSTIEITMPDGSPATPEVLYAAIKDED
ncbi:MAG: hypothetical protein R2911_40645 [Caldilineaceae bacterium]